MAHAAPEEAHQACLLIKSKAGGTKFVADVFCFNVNIGTENGVRVGCCCT